MRRILCVLLLACMSPVHAQDVYEEARRPFDEQVAELHARAGAVHSLKGEDVPACQRVWAFLQLAHSYAMSDEPQLRQWFLETNGVAGAGEAIFTHYLQEGLRLLFGPEGPVEHYDPALGTMVTGRASTAAGPETPEPEYSEEAARDAIIQECQELGELWGALFGELDTAGVSTAPLEKYLNEISTSVSSDKPFSEASDIIVAGEAFLEAMDNARTMTNGSGS